MTVEFKLVPEPPTDLEFVETARSAVPPILDAEDDCCTRVARQPGVKSRDEARTWLTFLLAPELAREGPSGFNRTRRDPDRTELGRAFRERVYGVEVVLETIADADRALVAEDVYEQFGPGLP